MNNNNDSLLKLENKLEEYTDKDITMAKFNICKPSMKLDFALNKKVLNDFLEQFKQSTQEVVENSEKYNIEGNSDNEIVNDNNTGNHSLNKNKEGKIQLDLALGILEEKEEKEIEIKDIIDHCNNNNNDDIGNDNKEEAEGTKELLKFIMKK